MIPGQGSSHPQGHLFFSLGVPTGRSPVSAPGCFIRPLVGAWLAVGGSRWKEQGEGVDVAVESQCLSHTGQEVADRWYNEIKNYNFQQPGFTSGTGE